MDERHDFEMQLLRPIKLFWDTLITLLWFG